MASTDYYQLLGVAPTASSEEIKRAYRRKARELHPDANQGDSTSEERFKEVAVAYEVLSDPDRRRRYDTFGPEGANGGGEPFGFGGGIGDIFDAFFGGAGASPFGGGGRGRGQAGPPAGADMEVTVQIDFEAAVFGASQDVSLRLPVMCNACEGSGARPGRAPVTCQECRGSGSVRRVRQSILGQMVTAGPCPRCGGAGQVIADPCPDCRGDGRRTEQRSWTIDIPAGVADGNTLRLSARGAAGPRGGRNGDLFVHLRVRPHERFARQGDDLVHELHVPFTQASLGAMRALQTLDGVEEVIVAPGTQTGEVLRLRDLGVPHVHGKGRGDLLVSIVVDTPTDLSPAEADLLRSLAAERGEEVEPPDTGLFSRIRGAFR